jgi:hypothetical protein
MKFSLPRLFVFAAVIVLTPSLAFAAFNDVTLTTDAVIQVGSYTLDVSGSTAAVQSITVNPTNFSVTLASGSSLIVSSPAFQQLSSDVTSDVITNTCTGSASLISLAYSGAGTVTNVVTPSAMVCSGSSTTPAPSNAGGGGLIVGSGPLAPGYVNTHTTGTATPLTLPGSSTQSSVKTSVAGAQPATTTPGIVISRNYQMWDRSEDIRVLQKFFNTYGFVVAQRGPGSPGNETSIFGVNTYRALIKYQRSQGLPQTGYIGPLTRAALGSAPSSTETFSPAR